MNNKMIYIYIYIFKKHDNLETKWKNVDELKKKERMDLKKGLVIKIRCKSFVEKIVGTERLVL